MPYSLLVSREVVLANAAHWAEPAVGDLLEGGPRSYSCVVVAKFRIIDITTNITDILLHDCSSCHNKETR